MTIQLPPNPWDRDGLRGACVAETGTPSASQLRLDMAYPKGTGSQRVRLEHQFIGQFCNHCPIKKQCGEYGKNEEFGIWGGRTEKQRKQDKKMLSFLYSL